MSEKTSLGLDLKRQGNDLLLLWNSDAPAVRAAVTGILVIQAGGNYEDIVLGAEDLRTGEFAYRSTANQLDIRLHVYDRNDRRTNDSALFSLPPERNGESVYHRRPPAHSVETGHESFTTASRPLKLVPAANRMGALLRSGTNVPHADPMVATPLQLAEPPRLESSQSLFDTTTLMGSLPFARTVSSFGEQRSVTKPRGDPAGSLPVVGEGPQVSPIRRAVTAIPFVKRLFHNPDFAPPTPSLSPLPEIPESLRQGLKQEVSVDVKVFVTAAGDVQYAELLTDATGRDRELAVLAVFESRRWKFHPALMRGKPRDSEVVLHYRFGPPAERE